MKSIGSANRACATAGSSSSARRVHASHCWASQQWHAAWALLTLIACNTAFAGVVTSFDDIDYWVGAGASQAALVIDWNGESADDESHTWGYRWDGDASGFDMLLAVVAADTRLFTKLRTESALGVGVFGIGYDVNDNGQFTISDDTAFDARGVAYADAADDFVTAQEAADAYREGWSLGVWSYGVANSNPWTSSWFRSPVGPSSRALVNGAWDSWAFMHPVRPNVAVFAANPVAADSPITAAGADFDEDGDVDGADFLTWQRGLGTPAATHEHGDANADATVDALDLSQWRAVFGASEPGSGFSQLTVSAVPEPSAALQLISIVVILLRSTLLQWRRIS